MKTYWNPATCLSWFVQCGCVGPYLNKAKHHHKSEEEGFSETGWSSFTQLGLCFTKFSIKT